MAFKATLTFSGKQYDVLQCSYSMYRDVDPKGRPTSGVYGGKIDVEVESNQDTSIIEAMVNNQFKAVTGSLTIKKQDEDAKMKEILNSRTKIPVFCGRDCKPTNFAYNTLKIKE